MRTTRHKATICPSCGKRLDASTHPDRATPSAGDVSICLHCGEVAIYRADRSLRSPTPAELREIAEDPMFQRMMRARL